VRSSHLAVWIVFALMTGGLLALRPAGAAAASAGSGDLCLFGSDITQDTGHPMMAGTDPAITGLAGTNAEIAFQSSSGSLNTDIDTTGAYGQPAYGMDPKSSPAISQAAGVVAVAFTANDDTLWGGNGTSETDSGQAMAAGTSPSVSVTGANAEYAYVSPSSQLIVGDGYTWTNPVLGTDAGSSPSIAALDGGGWEAAFEANTGTVWTYDSAGPSGNTGEAMNPGGTPQITALGTSGEYEIAFETNANQLAVEGNAGNTHTGEPMAPGTSPSIAPVGATGYETAFQGSNGDLWIYGSDGSRDTGEAMAPGTSPAVAATGAGYEVAYQCAPAAAPVSTTTTPSPTVPVTTVPVPTTPVTSTTPTTSPGPPPKAKSAPRIKAQFGLKITWNGRTSHVFNVKLEKKLPKAALVTFACRGTRRDRCPRLGKLAKRKRTLAKELAVVAGRTFTHNDLLVITVSAKGYSTETISVRLSGRGRPRYTLAWK
jgi:hypothetical protein